MADRVELLGAERIGQLTGSRDPQGRLLLNVTSGWTVEGVDLGANTEHNGRLYVFFGDVATTDNGDHRWQGWNFFLPNDRQGATGATGQPDWRFCGRCRGLFWAPRGDTTATVCPLGGRHAFHPDSWTFFLPNDRQGATGAIGQPDWRFCSRCSGLFFAPGGSAAATVCPLGGQHWYHPDSWMFVLPNDHQGATPETGQPNWGYCGKCHGLAWFSGGTDPYGDPWPPGACPAGNPRNADLVAWTDDTEITMPGSTGHGWAGWDFVLPNDRQGATASTGQPDWRFCSRCLGLFWAPHGDPAGSVCPAGGQHWYDPQSWTFFLPNDHQGATDATGQRDWRFCSICHGLFWAPDGDVRATVCPAGGGRAHWFDPQSWWFFLPNREHGAGDTTGQPNWRFCVQCHGLFWNGAPHNGVCAAVRGGGVRLHPVLKADTPEFDPFTAEWPVGLTKSLEVPGGAFSHNGRVYVFANMSPQRWSEHQRPGDPMYGTYLVSKDDPGRPGPYRMEFLFSPRVGACPRDEGGATLESHQPLGLTFILPHDLADGVPRQRGWRRCDRCAALFGDADGDGQGGRCWATGDVHRSTSTEYALPFAPGASKGQAAWLRCGQCDSLYWNGDPGGQRGRCRAGGAHQPTGPELALPYRDSFDDPNRLSQWRYCVKCAGLVWTGRFLVGDHNVCPADHKPHELMGLDFVLAYNTAEDDHRQGNWRHCRQCAGIFWAGPAQAQPPIYPNRPAGGCPVGGPHVAGNATAAPAPTLYAFVLPHDIPAGEHDQPDWRFCGRCAGLFWAGHPTAGVCPVGPGGHQAGAGPAAPGFDFVLSHISPGEDRFHERDWRFCARCFQLVFTGYDDNVSGVSPTVVRTADHPFLADVAAESTLVMTAFGFAPHTGFRLARMPLRPGAGPVLRDTQYWAGRDADHNDVWSDNPAAAADLFTHEGYTSVCTAWLPGPRRWLLLYSDAHDGDPNAFENPPYARIAATPMEWWQAPAVAVFDPQQAYGRYMHKPGLDDLDVRIPPPNDGHKGWAYGPYLLHRYTRWDETRRELDIYYLLSLSVPYQVQLMHTKLRISPA